MTRKILVVYFLFLLIAPFSAYASGGDLQITCEKGVKIYIDNSLRGTTNDNDNGLFIENLREGAINILAKKEGYADKNINANIVKNKTTHIQIRFESISEKVKKLAPEIESTVSAVGNIEFRSVPYGAKVYLDGNFKGDGDIQIENVAAGKHNIVFERNGQRIKGEYYVKENQTLKLKGSFRENKIINSTAEEEMSILPWKRSSDGYVYVDAGTTAYYKGNDFQLGRGMAVTQQQIVTDKTYEAVNYCRNLRLGGFSDWQVPDWNTGGYIVLLYKAAAFNNNLSMFYVTQGNDPNTIIGTCVAREGGDPKHGSLGVYTSAGVICYRQM